MRNRSRGMQRHVPSAVEQQLSSYGRLPIPSEQETLELARRVQRWLNCCPTDPEYRQIKRSGLRARDRMVSGNMRLVVYVATKYQNRGVPLEDLIQEGSMGLVTGTEKFDPTRGYTFSTYAFWWIRQAVLMSIYKQGEIIRVPAGTQDDVAKLRRFYAEKKSPPSTKEVIEHFGLSGEKQLERIFSAVRAQGCRSLSMQIGSKEDSFCLEDVYACPNQGVEQQEEMLEIAVRQDRLDQLLQVLSHQEQNIVHLQMMGLTGSEIGQMMKLSGSRVNQISKFAVEKLKAMVAREDAGLSAIGPATPEFPAVDGAIQATLPLNI